MVWLVSQPGKVCILMWFGHILYPQFSSFHCSEIPQNVVYFRENIGRKSPSSTMFSQGLLHTEEIIFETENKPSVEKISSCCSLFSVSEYVSIGTLSRCFKQVCLTPPGDAAAWKPMVLHEVQNKPCSWWSWSPLLSRPVGGRMRCLALAEPRHSSAGPPPLPRAGPGRPMATAELWFICPVIISAHYNHLEQHYRPHYGLGTHCH